ncbi:MAG: hypothetical protein K2M59_03900 [Muribaculaceae bacterium]|nr:hypothetical protein [Muribaculaceae bacterium]MDE7465554.1 hypothetical protein [Muribaculaceae bacterium]
MLIDCSYFTKGPRHILNASIGSNDKLPNPNGMEVNLAIEAYIAENQETFLRRMLGSSAGNKVNAYLVCLDDDERPNHIEGIDALCDKLKESFADYVFFHILRDLNTQATMTGLVRLKCANEYVSPIRRQVSIWNSMVEKNRLFSEWCSSSECAISGISIETDMLTYINSLNL